MTMMRVSVMMIPTRTADMMAILASGAYNILMPNPPPPTPPSGGEPRTRGQGTEMDKNGNYLKGFEMTKQI